MGLTTAETSVLDRISTEIAAMESLGSYLQQLRGSTSIREVSRRTGISAGQISRIENGETLKPARETLRALAREYGGHGVALELLAGYDDEETIHRADEEIVATVRGMAEYSTRLLEELDEYYVDPADAGSDPPEPIIPALLFEVSREYEAMRWVNEHGGDEELYRDVAGLREVAELWTRLTPERRKLVRAFVSDQEALSSLDPERGRYKVKINLSLNMGDRADD